MSADIQYCEERFCRVVLVMVGGGAGGVGVGAGGVGVGNGNGWWWCSTNCVVCLMFVRRVVVEVVVGGVARIFSILFNSKKYIESIFDDGTRLLTQNW